MCGIAGIYDPTLMDQARLVSLVRDMMKPLAHRGPDGEGWWCDPAAGIALGHQRLAIIDLSDLGRQPMLSADARWALVFNGEIYNFREIKAELHAQGCRFRGESDSEALLEACAHWGVLCAVKRVAGMFAFALWDRDERSLYLVRDRLGIKPLYWAQFGKRLLWASELQAIERSAGDFLHQDPDAVAALLRFGYIPAPLSIWREAQKLEPGTILQCGSDGVIVQRRYWGLRDAVEDGIANPIHDDSAAEDALDHLLQQVVAQHMISDVPMGAFLSGGIDSSIIVSVMQSLSTRPIRTFSIGFQSSEFNEAPYARAIANHLGTDHTELYATGKDALGVVDNLATIFDEPFADSSQIPTFLLSQMTRSHVTVALSGDGGDETFAGYSRYAQNIALRSILDRYAAPLLGARAFSLVARFFTKILRQDETTMQIERLIGYARNHDFRTYYRDRVSQWLVPETWVARSDSSRILRSWPDLPRPLQTTGERCGAMQYLDTLTYLPDDILTKVDRASMAVSLEARVPLVDHRIVEFAWRLLPSQKQRNGITKWILRRVLSRYLPLELFERPKMGFAVPMAEWLRGPLKGWAEHLLEPRALEAAGISDSRKLLSFWKQFNAGQHTGGADRLWPVLMLSAWTADRRRRQAEFRARGPLESVV